MQYCITRIQLSATGAIHRVEWGPLDAHALVMITDTTHSDVADVLRLLRHGKIVWASVQTPFGMALGALLRIQKDDEGNEALAIIPGGKLQSLHDIARF